MSKKDLLFRGYPNWEAFFFDLMVKGHGGPESTQEMYLELATVQRRQCVSYLVQKVREGEPDALTAIDWIATVI